MGNFLQALGSSNALPSALSSLQGVSQEMRAIETQKQQGVLQEQQQAVNAEYINQLKYQNQKMAEEEKQLNSPIDLTKHPIVMGMSEDVRKKWMDYGMSTGLVDQNGVTTQRGMKTLLGNIESSTKLFNEFVQDVKLGPARTDLEEKFKAYSKAQESGDDEKMKKASEEYEKSYANYQSLFGKVQEGEKYVKANQDRRMLQRQYAEMVQDPEYAKLPYIDKVGLELAAEQGNTAEFNKLVEKLTTRKEQGEKMPTSDFQTFYQGRRDELIKSGETDIGKINRTISKEWEDRQDKRATNKIVIKTELANQDKDLFNNWSKGEQESAIIYHLITGKPMSTVSSFDMVNKRQYTHGMAKFRESKGITPQQIAAMQADYKSMDMSTRNLRKQYDSMNGFVRNLDKQIDEVEAAFKKLPRTSLKLANMPIVKLRTLATGSGDEAAIASYLLEISNEAGKLSTSSTASVRELSKEGQDRWNKIHDPSLSFADLRKVLRATRQQANIRLESQREAMQMVKDELVGMSFGVASPPAPDAGGKISTAEDFKRKYGGK